MRMSAFIWDLDGTLLDSYEVIVSSLVQTYRELNIQLDPQNVHREVIMGSVGDFITKMEKETGLAFGPVKERYSAINDTGKLMIRPIDHAAETLAFIRERCIPNYVFTHRGTSSEIILKNIGLYDFFDEIVTGKDGFPRKPDPAAIRYLVGKYALDRSSCFYVGDRSLDIDCAVNAGIQSILYLPENSAAKPTGRETYIIRDLAEIRDLIAG